MCAFGLLCRYDSAHCDQLLAALLLLDTQVVAEGSLADAQALRCDLEKLVLGQKLDAGIEAHVAGWGDAAGEPVGVRFGKHKYRVPTLSKTKCTRSIEGSLGVFFSAYIAAWVVLFSLDYGMEAFVLALGAALFTALVEAVSPHGWDNFTTQLAGCVGVYLLLLV